MTPTETPFTLCHTIRLTPAEVLDALRNAALARSRTVFSPAVSAAGTVELDTRVMATGAVEIDGATITVTTPLPERLIAMLREPVPVPLS
jgi:hypothetical protein